MSKRLNIMFYCAQTGEQITLPVNPENIKIKYEKEISTYNILDFGEVNVSGPYKPLKITLTHFLPDDNSVFGANSTILTDKNTEGVFIEHYYSKETASNIFKKWASERIRIRVVIEDEINSEFLIASYSETLRESTPIKPYELEIIEYRYPKSTLDTSFGLLKRTRSFSVPSEILMRACDTVYTIASIYHLNHKKLAKNNDIEDVNAKMTGKKLSTRGCQK